MRARIERAIAKPARRYMLAAALALALVVAIATPGTPDRTPPSQAEEPERPNIVVLMTDDQRPDTLRFMPAVRSLGGTYFRRYYLLQPLCCPARMTYLTGMSPSSHRVRSNFPARSPGLERVHALERRALPNWLREAGYVTGFTGKYFHGYPWHQAPYVPRGWNEWNARVSKGGEFDVVDKRHYNGTRIYTPGGHDTRVNSDWAVDFIRRHSGGEKPFFLTVAPIAPHTAYADIRQAPPRHLRNPFPLGKHRGTMNHLRAPGRAGRAENMGDKAALLRNLSPYPHSRADVYWRRKIEALRGVDEMVSRLRSVLRKRGEWQNTVFIFTSDNGYQLGEHRLWAKDLPYEEVSRVPLIATGPGFANRSANKLVADFDIPRTIAQIAGATPQLPQEGRPLGGNSRKQLVLGGTHTGQRRWQALIRRKWSFVDWTHSGNELYNLRRDPQQLRAVRGHHALKRNMARAIRRSG